MKTLFKKSGTPNIVTFVINTLYQINEISRTKLVQLQLKLSLMQYFLTVIVQTNVLPKTM